MTKRSYNKNNCTSQVRAVITTKFGDVITLMGTHGFEWSIVSNINGDITMTSYKSRKQATENFKHLERAYVKQKKK